jgi:dihydroflavonol-4-reductase
VTRTAIAQDVREGGVTIGITGAAGFLGATLVRFLHERSAGRDRIVPFCSRHVSNPLTDGLGLHYERMDVTCREEVLRQTRGIDVLYHLAGVVDYSRRGRRRTWDVNVIGTQNVLDACRENRIGRLVCASSISVLGAPAAPGGTADEGNDSYAPGRNPVSFSCPEEALRAAEDSFRGDYGFLGRVKVPYFDSKLAAFELARREAARGGVSLAIVLAGTAVGAGDTGLSIGALVERVFDGKLAVTLPGGTSFVSAEDVARGMHLAAARGGEGEAYVITGEERDNLSYRDFMRLVARVAREDFGRRCRGDFIVVPGPAAVAAARVVETVFPRASLQVGLALSGCITHRFDCRKARERLGYAPSVPLEEAVRACIAFRQSLRKETH